MHLCLSVFQSTLPRGSDDRLGKLTLAYAISIHAPSRERQLSGTLRRNAENFNPRSLAGATLCRAVIEDSVIVFQSTLPRGSDDAEARRTRRARNFNPRSLAGATQQAYHRQAARANFNPRSLAGATIYLLAVKTNFKNFNPRSLAGATRKPYHWRHRGKHFNPRSLAGATEDMILKEYILKISIHAPSRERPAACPPWRARGHFNPRSLAGATNIVKVKVKPKIISIHAPSRERRLVGS